MNILHIDSSITGAASVSRQLTAAVVDAYRAAVPGATVTRRDLVAAPVPHLTALTTGRVPVPADVDAAFLLERLKAIDAEFSLGVGAGADRLIRLNHTGRRADPQVVHAMISALATALRR